MLSNPPYGEGWKGDLERIRDGIKDPRFVVSRAGDPEYALITRASYGQKPFLANMLSKMKCDTRLGSCIAKVSRTDDCIDLRRGQPRGHARPDRPTP